MLCPDWEVPLHGVRIRGVAHVRALAALDLIFGTLLLLAGVAFFVLYGLVGHFAGIPWLEHILLGVGGVAGGILSILGTLLGLSGALLLGRPGGASRILQTVAVAPHMLNMPFGTALALYAIWVCWMNPPSRALFETEPAPLPYAV